jgi:hypothetical protein
VAVDWVGSRTFWVAAYDTSNVLGATTGTKVMQIDVPQAPVIDNTASLVGGVLITQYRLTWQTSVLGTNNLPVARYEVGYDVTTLSSVNGTSYIAGADWLGDRTFFVRAIDVNGNVGTPSSKTLTIAAPTAPATMIIQVVDNNVLIYWGGASSTLPIDYYEFAKEATFNSSAIATYIGKKSGGFTTVFETAAGAYTYYMRGIDAAGNVGATKSTTATVSQPPDYILNKNWPSTFSGTQVNATLDVDGSLLMPSNTTETWTTHFTGNAWTTPQNQVDAGYPYYAMPTPTSGYYEETFDYGTQLAATKVTVTPTATSYGVPSVQCDIGYSADGTNYTSFSNVYSIYATAFRYVKVRISVGATGNNDQYDIRALNVTLDSKIKNDAGMVKCIANVTGTYTQTLFAITVTASGTWTVGQVVYIDFTSGVAPDGVYTITVGGTGSFQVTSVNSVTIGTSNCTVDGDGTPTYLNTPFIDITSITVTASGTTPRTVLYNFVDIPNPTYFKALLFDNGGTRQPGTVSWSVKGY